MRRINRQGSKGVTLVEVLITGLIMVGLNLVLYWVMVYAASGQRKQDSSSQGERACGVALNKIQNRLLEARVLEPLVGDTSDTLVYEYASRTPDGGFALDATGNPIWMGPITLHLEVDPQSGEASLMGAQHTMAPAPSPSPPLPNPSPSASPTPNPPQILMGLGPEGKLEFHRLSDHLLEVTVEAGRTTDKDASRSYHSRASVRLYLQNQGP